MSLTQDDPKNPYNQSQLVGENAGRVYTVADVVHALGANSGVSTNYAVRALHEAGVEADAYITHRHPQPGRADRYIALFLDRDAAVSKLLDAVTLYEEKRRAKEQERSTAPPKPPKPPQPPKPGTAPRYSQAVITLTGLAKRWRCSTDSIRAWMVTDDAPRRLPTSTEAHPRWLIGHIEAYEQRLYGGASR